MKINVTIGPKHAGDNDIVDIVENEDSITVHYKALPGRMHTYVTIGKDTLVEWYSEYSGGGEDYNFDTLLRQFAPVVAINSTFTNTYAYLESIFDAAVDEWENNTNGFFDASMYPELPEVEQLEAYRGNNTPSGVNVKNVMTSWAIAMALAELVPTSSVAREDNNQTALFIIAYNIGRGRECPLYGGYSLHQDPMIARLAAAAVYVLIRGDKSTSDIGDLRTEINNKLGTNYGVINAYDFSGLGFVSGGNGSLPTKIGYLVNSDAIIAAAPGPYTTGHEDETIAGVQRDKPYEQGQSQSLFCTSSSVSGYQEWWMYNYLVDIAVDNIVCQNYIMAVPEGSTAAQVQALESQWINYSLDKKQILLSAAAAPGASSRFFFGSRKLHFDGISVGKYINFQNPVNIQNGYWTDAISGITYYNNETYYNGTVVHGVQQPTYYFFKFSEDVSNPDYTLSGPFGDLENRVFNSRIYEDIHAVAFDFIDTVNDIGDNSRYPTYRIEYDRRRRPLGGSVSGTTRSNSFGDPLNGFTNGTLATIFASSAESYDKHLCGNDWPNDGARSYPSGHSSQCMTTALMLGQMNAANYPERIKQYIAEAYKIGVGRTVTRYHWQSDVIYGRLFATMILPIINAMSGLMDGYSEARCNLCNPWGKMTLTIVNNLGSPITIDNKGSFYIHWPNSGHNGVYLYIDDPRADIVVPAGPSTWNNVRYVGNSSADLVDAPLGRDPDDAPKLYMSVSNHINIVDAGLASSVVLTETGTSDPSTDTLNNGGSYTLTIN